MSKEAMKLALNKAFQLGQRYWSWADSEYSSHWKKADAAKAEFDQLVQDTINAALAEQPAQQEPVAWWDSKLGVFDEKHFDQLQPLYTSPQPAKTSKPWVGLTDDERLEVAEIDGADEWFWKVCKAIEAKLRERNT